jgi:hypothetical protein
MNDLDLVRAQLATAFVFDTEGHIVAHNDPPRTPADFKLLLSGCADGNVECFTAGLDNVQRHAIAALFDAEPPLAGFAQHPVHLAAYAKILGTDAPKIAIGLNWHLPHDVRSPVTARIVMSGTAEGEALLARFQREGMPASLVALGFPDTDEFWPPWVAVFDGDDVAALGFAARLGGEGADLGLVTVPAFRGRGYGAAATAAWAAHPALAKHTLFYSTSLTNLSSQRVVARLGLRFIGTTFRIG